MINDLIILKQLIIGGEFFLPDARIEAMPNDLVLKKVYSQFTCLLTIAITVYNVKAIRGKVKFDIFASLSNIIALNKIKFLFFLAYFKFNYNLLFYFQFDNLLLTIKITSCTCNSILLTAV